MAKRKGAMEFLETFLAKPGATKKEAAARVNRSVSTINRVLAGKTTGERIRPAVQQLARRAPTPTGKAPRPVPAAPAPAPRREMPPAPEFVRITLPTGSRATVMPGGPDSRALRRELRGVDLQQAQVVVVFADGKRVTLFSHGGYDAIKLRRQLADPAWLGKYLERLGYKPNSRGGIAQTQVVLL